MPTEKVMSLFIKMVSFYSLIQGWDKLRLLSLRKRRKISKPGFVIQIKWVPSSARVVDCLRRLRAYDIRIRRNLKMKNSVGTNWMRRVLRKIIIDRSKVFCKIIRCLNKVPPIRNRVEVDIFPKWKPVFPNVLRWRF